MSQGIFKENWETDIDWKQIEVMKDEQINRIVNSIIIDGNGNLKKVESEINTLIPQKLKQKLEKNIENERLLLESQTQMEELLAKPKYNYVSFLDDLEYQLEKKMELNVFYKQLLDLVKYIYYKEADNSLLKFSSNIKNVKKNFEIEKKLQKKLDELKNILKSNKSKKGQIIPMCNEPCSKNQVNVSNFENINASENIYVNWIVELYLKNKSIITAFPITVLVVFKQTLRTSSIMRPTELFKTDYFGDFDFQPVETTKLFGNRLSNLFKNTAEIVPFANSLAIEIVESVAPQRASDFKMNLQLEMPRVLKNREQQKLLEYRGTVAGIPVRQIEASPEKIETSLEKIETSQISVVDRIITTVTNIVTDNLTKKNMYSTIFMAVALISFHANLTK